MDLISTAIARTLTPELAAQLRVLFDWSAIEVRPGSVRKEGAGTLALAYADPCVRGTAR